MPRLGLKQIVVSLWVAANLGLAADIGFQTGWGGHLHLAAPEPVALAPEKVKTELLDEYRLPPVDEGFTQTLKRPLFVPTRRPAPPAPVAAAPQPTMKKGQFQLTGVMITPAASFAVLREVASGKTRIVKKGDSIDGVVVKEVEPERAVLSQYGDQETLTMKVQPSPKTKQLPSNALIPSPITPKMKAKLQELQKTAVSGTKPQITHRPVKHGVFGP